MNVSAGNLDRFTGFADLYDANRPSPPARLGPMLARYAGVERPEVVDLGSGTGLSSRWAAGWAASVVGVEPNPDMRAQAIARPAPGVRHVAGTSDATGLPDASADVVLAVQAMHWMEPESTLREVARLLRPGGVFAVVDADWPPVSGSAPAELAWALVHARVRVLEARLARGADDAELRRPIGTDDPDLADDDLVDPHRNRLIPGGVRSWSKSAHLERLRESGRFAFVREVVLDDDVDLAGELVADRFVALQRSQGSYQGLRRAGLTDDEIGLTEFERDARAALGTARALSFCWRVRLGVVAR